MKKKARAKAKKTAKKAAKEAVKESAAKKSTAKPKKEADFVEVRRNIANMVQKSAKGMAQKVIDAAMTGQLAQTKYIFEAVGLYPPTEETASRPQDSLAYTLLKRMGLPTEPVVVEEDDAPSTPVVVKSATRADEEGEDEGREGRENECGSSGEAGEGGEAHI